MRTVPNRLRLDGFFMLRHLPVVRTPPEAFDGKDIKRQFYFFRGGKLPERISGFRSNNSRLRPAAAFPPFGTFTARNNFQKIKPQFTSDRVPRFKSADHGDSVDR